MVPRKRLLLVVAADKRELDALLDRGGFTRVRGPVRWAWNGRLGESEAVLVANGAGRAQARKAVEWAEGKFAVKAVVSTGFAGATQPEWRLGEGVLVERIRQADLSLEYAVKLPVLLADEAPRKGSLITIDRIAQTSEDKRRFAAEGADVVDMEASAVAQAAERMGVPFYCVRAVSDDAEQRFAIDFNRALRPDGSFSVASVVWQAGWHRDRWRALLELRENARVAAKTISNLLLSCQFPA